MAKTEERFEKVFELLETTEFLEKAQALDSMEEFQQLLQANGVELTDDEMESLAQRIIQYAGDEMSGEIFEQDLDSVSGGAVLTASAIGFWMTTSNALKHISRMPRISPSPGKMKGKKR